MALRGLTGQAWRGPPSLPRPDSIEARAPGQVRVEDRRTEPTLPPPTPPRVPQDIDVAPFKRRLPVSRGAPERKLQRVDRYDRRAQVTEYETLTSTGTVMVSFRVVDDQPFRFDPGQFVGISAKIPRYGVRKTPYCISSPRTTSGRSGSSSASCRRVLSRTTSARCGWAT